MTLKCEHGKDALEFCGHCAVKKTKVNVYCVERSSNTSARLGVVIIAQIATACEDYGMKIVSTFYDSYREQYVMLIYGTSEQHQYLEARQADGW